MYSVDLNNCFNAVVRFYTKHSLSFGHRFKQSKKLNPLLIMVVMTEIIGKSKIRKTIIKQGSGKKPTFQTGGKATFHFKTIDTKSEKKTVIDDSRNFKKPFELLIGRSFKLECWEECVTTMMNGEIARFSCPLQSVTDYPVISRSLRDLYHGKDHTSHSCGLHAVENGLGYEDLNQLQRSMRPLDFEIELLKVEEPNSYEKELWQMSPEEMISSAPKFHSEGNELFAQGKTVEAEQKYAKGIGCLKHLQLKERPGTETWMKLDEQQIPLLLNYAQCKLNQEEYALCITHCTEVIEKLAGNENVKALFKRGKAYACVLDAKECKADFARAVKLDPSIKPIVDRELRALDARQKQRDNELSRGLKGMFNQF